jgi:ribosomal protein L11 methyltransferase
VEYIELTAAVPAPDAERAADAVRLVTGAGVSIEHPFRQADVESGATTDPTGIAHVRIYLRASDGGGTAAGVAAALSAAGIQPRISERTVAEADWAEAWKEHFHIERFGRRVVVVPSWREYVERAGDAVVRLDPGMAFGTGQHETTRMCLEALDGAVACGARVVDVGCGSGILSIAAAKLGAADVIALDIDADAVRVTRDNARANGVGAVVAARQGTLTATREIAGRDIVVVNIIAAVIIEMAEPLVASLRAGGRLIASGVIAERERAVSAALERAGARIERVRAMGEWHCIEALCP